MDERVRCGILKSPGDKVKYGQTFLCDNNEWIGYENFKTCFNIPYAARLHYVGWCQVIKKGLEPKEFNRRRLFG